MFSLPKLLGCASVPLKRIKICAQCSDLYLLRTLCFNLIQLFTKGINQFFGFHFSFALTVKGSLDNNDVGDDVPLLTVIPVYVELRHYSVECWSANEPNRSLKEFQFCAAASARWSGLCAEVLQRSERNSTNSKTSACFSRGKASNLLISSAYPITHLAKLIDAGSIPPPCRVLTSIPAHPACHTCPPD